MCPRHKADEPHSTSGVANRTTDGTQLNSHGPWRVAGRGMTAVDAHSVRTMLYRLSRAPTPAQSLLRIGALRSCSETWNDET